jgi:hypothetical protein
MNYLYFIILIILIILTFIFYKYYQVKETFGTLRVINEQDKNNAIKFALKTICKKNGHKWVSLGGEFEFDCKFTKESCVKKSIYPTPKGEPPKYYEWRDSKSEDAKKVVENTLNSKSKNIKVTDKSQETLSKKIGLSSASQKSSDILDEEGLCIVGNEYFRKFCEDNNLTYNKDTGQCVTNETYCLKRVLPFCGGDCFKPPGSWVSEAIFGTTLGRSLAALENYTVAGQCKVIQESEKAIKKNS